MKVIGMQRFELFKKNNNKQIKPKQTHTSFHFLSPIEFEIAHVVKLHNTKQIKINLKTCIS